MLLLYLSLCFKTHRQAYYDHLQKVRTEGDLEDWLRFFLTGVMETAVQATHAAKSILSLFEKDRGKIEKLGRPAGSALRVHEYLQKKPIISVASTAQKLGLTEPTIRASLVHLAKLGIVKEMRGGSATGCSCIDAISTFSMKGRSRYVVSKCG